MRTSSIYTHSEFPFIQIVRRLFLTNLPQSDDEHTENDHTETAAVRVARREGNSRGRRRNRISQYWLKNMRKRQRRAGPERLKSNGVNRNMQSSSTKTRYLEHLDVTLSHSLRWTICILWMISLAWITKLHFKVTGPSSTLSLVKFKAFITTWKCFSVWYKRLPKNLRSLRITKGYYFVTCELWYTCELR